MPEESFQERTERATPRRREKARERGQVAKSVDLNAAGIICLGFTALFLVGPHLVGRVQEMMRHTMANAPSIAVSDPTFHTVFVDNITGFLTTMAPVFIAMTAIGFAINVLQVGFKITPKAMEPKFEKLNVVSGLKRLFSMRSAVQMVRDPLKMAAVALIAFLAISSEFESFFGLPDLSVSQLGTMLGRLALITALKIGAAILVIGIIDFIYQRYEFEKSIKMSKQEIKDESKDTEGNPEIRARTRQIQRQMARQRMMASVPEADVVVTNPTHLAVALKYDPDQMDAPTVLAKGQRLIAEKIKQIAREHGIPIIEDKPLARSLYKLCDVGDLIPARLYKAVAEILAHIYRLKGQKVR
jgi:flagellar biosynthetic protein FlhB